jgi:hypothetical protein
LHQNTYHVAAKTMRAERRRKSREREAIEMNSLQEDPRADLRQVAPILDEAITQLGSEDRTAILLRFFEQRDFRQVGEALGSNEDAARMRVTRALEKLNVLLKRRGVTLSIAVLGAVLTAGAVTAAPAGMVGSISSVALAGATAGTGTTLTILKLMANTKLKLSLATLLVAGAASTLVIQHQSLARLDQENQSFRRRIAQLTPQDESHSSVATGVKELAALPSDQFQELLRLRSEVGILRQQTNELARLRQENQNLLSRESAHSEPTNQVSEEDQYILRERHTVRTMNTLLMAIKNYATDHDGLYPVSFDQLIASGNLETTNFADNLRLDDFKIETNAFDGQNKKIILSLREPIRRLGGPAESLIAVINSNGVINMKSIYVRP